MIFWIIPILSQTTFTCQNVKDLFRQQDCCTSPDKKLFDSHCDDDQRSAMGTYSTLDNTNYIEDPSLTKEHIISKHPTVNYTQINPFGYEGGWGVSTLHAPAITRTHYYTTVSRGIRDNDVNFGTYSGSDIVSETDIQCRSRDTDELVWTVTLSELLDISNMFVTDLTVEDGTVYGSAYTHYQINSGVFVFALDAYTGLSKYVVRTDRMHVTFDNIKWIPDGFQNPHDVPYAMRDEIPEFKLRFGDVSTAPLKVGCSSGTMQSALEKLGLRNVFVQRNDPYEYVQNDGTVERVLSDYGKLSSGALSYDLIFTAKRGIHYTTDADKGVVYDDLLNAKNAGQQIQYFSGDPGPYDFIKYSLTTHLVERPEEESYAFTLPLLHVDMLETPPLEDNTVGYVARADNLHMVAASHVAPHVVGDGLLVVASTAAYHHGQVSMGGDGHWKRYARDQMTVMRLNRHTGRVIWIHKNSPDHLLVNQKIPESAAMLDINGNTNPDLWFRRFLTDDDALTNLPPDVSTVRLFFAWGVPMSQQYESEESVRMMNDGLLTSYAAYGPQYTGALLKQYPEIWDDNVSSVVPSGNRFPGTLEGAVYIDGPRNGLVISRGSDGLMPLIDGTDITHPMYIDWDLPSTRTGKPWPDDFNNMFFFYKKGVGSRIAHEQEELQLMYSGTSCYGRSLSVHPDSHTIFYTTGHNYHIPLNDLIRVIELDTGIPFDPSSYSGQTNGFNPVGTWRNFYQPFTFSGFLEASLKGDTFSPYMLLFSSANMQVTHYIDMRMDMVNNISSYKNLGLPISQLKAIVDEQEGLLISRLEKLDSWMTHLPLRGIFNYAGAAVALDWKTGSFRWGSRNVINNVFKHGGPFTYGFTPNQGNNNGAMVIDNLHEKYDVILSTSKTGSVDRFLFEDLDETLEVDGFVYPPDVIDRAGKRNKVPIRKILGIGDQFGGVVFGSWAYDKKMKILVTSQQNTINYGAVGFWGKDDNWLSTKYWMLRTGEDAGTFLAGADGFLNENYNRYLTFMDMTDPDMKSALINEVPIAKYNPPDSTENGRNYNILDVNGMIFVAQSRSDSSTVDIATLDNRTRESVTKHGTPLICYSAYDVTTGKPIWTSQWMVHENFNTPPIVDGEMFASAPMRRTYPRKFLSAAARDYIRIKW